MVNHGIMSQLASLGGHIIDGPRRRTASKVTATLEPKQSPSQSGSRLTAIAAPPRHCSFFVRATPTTPHHFAEAVCNDDNSHCPVGARSGASNHAVTPGPQVARGVGELGCRTAFQDDEHPCAARVSRIGTPALPTASRGHCHLNPPYPVTSFGPRLTHAETASSTPPLPAHGPPSGPTRNGRAAPHLSPLYPFLH